MVVSSIAVNLLSSLAYDMIKALLAEKRRPLTTTLRVVITPQPDGSTVLVITGEE